MKKYYQLTLSLTFILMLMIAGLNWLVNPYQVFNSPVIPGVNELTTENFYKQLLFKPHQLRQIHPRSVIIGTSPAGILFNPMELPQPAYNLAIGGATSYINYRLLQEALDVNPDLDTVIYELSFFSFNADNPDNIANNDPAFESRLALNPDGSGNRLGIFYRWQDKADSLITWDVTRASFRTINKQSRVLEKRKGSFIQNRNGQWTQQLPPGTSTYTLFEGSWKKYLYNDCFPAPMYRFTLSRDENNSPLAYFRQSLKLLYARDVKTHLIIAPQHASLLLLLHEAGLWQTLTTWKQLLVSINNDEAAKAGKTPYPLVDYNFINAYTTENFPESQHPNQRLQWFVDSSHASPAFGGIILQELQSGNIGIGMPLHNASIADYLKKSEQDIAAYSTNNPELRQKILTIMDEAPPGIRFPSRQPALESQPGKPL